MLDQPEARALLITDQRVHEQWMLAPYVEGVEPIDKFQLAYKRGARAAIAEDIEELAYLPEEWGYDGEAARDTLLEFNRQCEAGELEPGRRLDPAPLVTRPYYVIEVIPAITFTFTGLRIDERARVLGADGAADPRACWPPVRMPAASSTAPTPAASRPRWCSACRPRATATQARLAL